MARLALLLVAGLGARSAAAAPPACFPTRYLGEITPLVGGDRKFGMLAPGGKVTILEDDVSLEGRLERPSLARLEIERPVHLTPLVPRWRLWVFLRHDVPIEPGMTWWRAGTPMWVVRSHEGRVEVDQAGTSRRESPVTVDCADLTAAPLGGTKPRQVCDLCMPQPLLPKPARTGRPVCWEQRSFELGSAGFTDPRAAIESSEGTLVRREGERVLVEILSKDLRLWRWLPATAVKRHCPVDDRLIAISDPCCLKGGVDPKLHGAVLAAPAPLLPALGTPLLTMLPAGTAVVWDQEQDGWRRVLIRWPNADWSGRWTLQLEGFVPSAALRDAPAPKRASWRIGMPNWAPPFPARSADGGAGADAGR